MNISVQIEDQKLTRVDDYISCSIADKVVDKSELENTPSQNLLNNMRVTSTSQKKTQKSSKSIIKGRNSPLNAPLSPGKKTSFLENLKKAQEDIIMQSSADWQIEEVMSLNKQSNQNNKGNNSQSQNINQLDTQNTRISTEMKSRQFPTLSRNSNKGIISLIDDNQINMEKRNSDNSKISANSNKSSGNSMVSHNSNLKRMSHTKTKLEEIRETNSVESIEEYNKQNKAIKELNKDQDHVRMSGISN